MRKFIYVHWHDTMAGAWIDAAAIHGIIVGTDDTVSLMLPTGTFAIMESEQAVFEQIGAMHGENGTIVIPS